MPNLTSNFSFNLPLVNDATDEDLWGGYLNSNWDDLDTELQSVKTASELPVGYVAINTTGTNPNSELGYGTWEAFGAGRVLVGLDSGDSDFDTAEETGGAKTHTLTPGEIPPLSGTVDGSSNFGTGPGQSLGDTGTGSGSIGVTVNSGGGGAHNNVQPYIVVYMFKRTA